MQTVTSLKQQINTTAKAIAALTQILANGTLAHTQQQHVVANIKAMHSLIKNANIQLNNLSK